MQLPEDRKQWANCKIVLVLALRLQELLVAYYSLGNIRSALQALLGT